jgi:hypothetical protein
MGIGLKRDRRRGVVLAAMEAVGMDTLTDPAFTGNLQELNLGELRARRDRCSEAEVGLSYARRIVHGRLDIVGAERERRSGTGAALGSLVDRLPAILSEHVHAPGNGRLPRIMIPAEVDLEASHTVDTIAPLASMGTVSDLPDEELNRIEAGLVEFEHEVSAQRRLLHVVIDKLQEEVIRRYRSGEADVNDLLR